MPYTESMDMRDALAQNAAIQLLIRQIRLA